MYPKLDQNPSNMATLIQMVRDLYRSRRSLQKAVVIQRHFFYLDICGRIVGAPIWGGLLPLLFSASYVWCYFQPPIFGAIQSPIYGSVF